MEDLSAKEKIDKASSALIRDQIFFGSLLLRMNVKPDNCKTGWIDGKTLAYGEHFVNSLSLNQTKTFLAHEILHIALKHHLRRMGREGRLWNIAGDYVINLLLVDSGFEPLDNWLYDKKFIGLSIEEVFRELEKEEQKKQEEQQEQSGNGEGEENNDESETGKEESESGEEETESDGESEGESGEDPEPGGNAEEAADGEGEKEEGEEEGSGQGGKGEQEEEQGEEVGGGKSGNGENSPEENGENSDSEGEGFDGDVGEVRDFPDPDSQDEEEVGTTVALAQALACGKARNQLSPMLKEMAEEILDPMLDPIELLKNFIDRNYKSDYSWRQPNKRFIANGLYLPSLTPNRPDNGVFVVDTSGSIYSNRKLLDQIAAEISHIMDVMQFNMTVIYCDDQVRKVEEYQPGDEIKPDFPGGWGTDFRPPFKYLEDNGIEPTFLIYFTDLACWDYPPEPNYPVVWIDYLHIYKPKFGEHIKI